MPRLASSIVTSTPLSRSCQALHQSHPDDSSRGLRFVPVCPRVPSECARGCGQLRDSCVHTTRPDTKHYGARRHQAAMAVNYQQGHDLGTSIRAHLKAAFSGLVGVDGHGDTWEVFG